MTFCLTLPVWGHRLGRSRLQQAQAGMRTGAFWPADTNQIRSLPLQPSLFPSLFLAPGKNVVCWAVAVDPAWFIL